MALKAVAGNPGAKAIPPSGDVPHCVTIATCLYPWQRVHRCGRGDRRKGEPTDTPLSLRSDWLIRSWDYVLARWDKARWGWVVWDPLFLGYGVAGNLGNFLMKALERMFWKKCCDPYSKKYVTCHIFWVLQIFCYDCVLMWISRNLREN